MSADRPLPGSSPASSLRARLTLFLLALALAAISLVGGATYLKVLNEAGQLFDYQLRQMALSLRDQGSIAEDERRALSNERFDFAIQIRADDGNAIYSSIIAPPLPQRAVLGYQDVVIDGVSWRVFSAAAPGRVIQVGQPLQVRRDLAAEAAWRSVLPLVISAPLVALAVWWLVNASFAPLARVTSAAARQRAGALEPLPVAGLPAEIAPVVQGFNALLARLQTAFAAQRSFVADAAHELRSPLAALKLQLRLLSGATDEPTRAEALAQLGAGIDRAAHLIDQLLALARAEPESVQAVRRPVDLAEAARLACADEVPLASARKFELNFDAPEAVTVQGDADALRVLTRNLVDNAIRHSGGHRVDVWVGTREGVPVLTVADDGGGIPLAERERVFDRFYRRERGDSQGSGLGMAIVGAIAARHRASVRLDTSAAGGLLVEVRFAGEDRAQGNAAGS